MKFLKKPLQVQLTLLAGLMALMLCASARGDESLRGVVIDNHSCLMAGPTDLPAGAPVVLILHGLGGNKGDLFGICQELHLPPCRIVLPDAPLVLPGYDPGHFAWYNLQ